MNDEAKLDRLERIVANILAQSRNPQANINPADLPYIIADAAVGFFNSLAKNSLSGSQGSVANTSTDGLARDEHLNSSSHPPSEKEAEGGS